MVPPVCAGALDAVADAKRALSSHPLPDAAQPLGAAESVAAAQKALAVVPTEYDDDGPVPPLRDTLAAIEAAREVMSPTHSHLHLLLTMCA